MMYVTISHQTWPWECPCRLPFWSALADLPLESPCRLAFGVPPLESPCHLTLGVRLHTLLHTCAPEFKLIVITVRSYNVLCFLWQFPLTESRKKLLDKYEQDTNLLLNDAVDFMPFPSHLTVHLNHPWKITPTEAN